MRNLIGLALWLLRDQVVLLIVCQDHMRLLRAKAANVGAKHDGVWRLARELGHLLVTVDHEVLSGNRPGQRPVQLSSL